MAQTTKQRQAAAPAVDPYLAAAQAGIDSAPQEGKRSSYLHLPTGCQWSNFARGQTYRCLHLTFTWGKHPQQGLLTGQLGTVLRLTVHNNIGPNSQRILCNQIMFGKKCAVCDEYTRRAGGRVGRLPKDEYKALAPLRTNTRSARLFHVIGGAPDNIVVLEEATSLFDDFFTSLVANRENYKMFAHPTKGMIVEITGREKPIGEGSCTEFATIVMTEFSKKAGSIERMPQALVDKAKGIVFDSCLVMPPKYEDVMKMVRGFVPEETNGSVSASTGGEITEEASETAEAPEAPEATEDVVETVDEPSEATEDVVETIDESVTEPEPEAEEPEVVEDIDEPVPEPAIEVGSSVGFTFKGTAKEGEVKAIEGEKAKVKVGNQVFTVKLDQLTVS